MPANPEDQTALAAALPSRADGIIPLAQSRATPGRVVGGANMTIHTRQAHRLFYGRRSDEKAGKAPITGLVRFANTVANIHNAASRDDPFADWTLCDLEARFESADTVIGKHTAHLASLLDANDGLKIGLHASVKPISIPLRFYAPLAWRGAQTLTKLDQLVLHALTARQVALMFEDDWKESVSRAARAVRQAYEWVNVWQYTGVTRDDLAANNAVARRALGIYQTSNRGVDIPADVLTGERRSKFAPTIRREAAGTAEDDPTLNTDDLEDAPRPDGDEESE